MTRRLTRRHVVLSAAVALLLVLGATAAVFPDYLRLLRPSVLKQLDPQVVRLVNELPGVDKQNKDIIGRLFAHGGLGHAKEGADGVMRVDVRAPSGEFIWKPAIVVMPHPGELEVELFNDDPHVHHAAILPSNGDKQYLTLPIHSRGTARVTLDGPGYYWFGCPVGNHVGRGMLGLILVKGDVPAGARLDRPPQSRP
jgi:PQQ system protein